MEEYSYEIRKIFITPYYKKISYIETYTYRKEYSTMSTTLKRKVTEEITLSDKRIKGNEFEKQIATILRRKKCNPIRTQPPDHGIDIFANKEGKQIIVQCKNQEKVGRPIIQQMAGIMTSYNSSNTIGCVIAQGFTQDAINYADEKVIIWATPINFERKLQDALERFSSTNTQEQIKLQRIREIEFKRLDGFTFTRKVTKNGNIYEETSTINQLEEGIIYF
jgi:hypothetical protein